MKHFVICALALGALCMGLGVTQFDDVDDEFLRIGQELADLGLRVSRLEHASGSASPAPAAAPSAADASPARTMILVSVSLSDHTDDNSAEIASLKRQHASLMNTVNQAADQADEDFGQQGYVGGAAAGARGWRGAAGGGVVTTNIGAIGRQVLGDEEMKNRYSTQAAIKKEELNRLHAADSDPKQILLGHDESGQTIFTLEAKYNLSSSLNSIAIGDTVTWTGTRLSANAGGETWAINSIRKVQ
jgi:hypothetical protein